MRQTKATHGALTLIYKGAGRYAPGTFRAPIPQRHTATINTTQSKVVSAQYVYVAIVVGGTCLGYRATRGAKRTSPGHLTAHCEARGKNQLC